MQRKACFEETKKITNSLKMLISFDPEIEWQPTYRRNNRSRIQKHILCFPNHTANHHIV